LQPFFSLTSSSFTKSSKLSAFSAFRVAKSIVRRGEGGGDLGGGEADTDGDGVVAS
jgi:hypothetical protein